MATAKRKASAGLDRARLIRTQFELEQARAKLAAVFPQEDEDPRQDRAVHVVSDPLGVFLRRCTIFLPAARTDPKELCAAFNDWARRNQLRALMQPSWREWSVAQVVRGMQEKGYGVHTIDGVECYSGTRLLAPDQEPFFEDMELRYEALLYEKNEKSKVLDDAGRDLKAALDLLRSCAGTLRILRGFAVAAEIDDFVEFFTERKSERERKLDVLAVGPVRRAAKPAERR